MFELRITLPNDFGERLEQYCEELLGQLQIAPTPVQQELSYDAQTATISYGERRLQLAYASNQRVLCDSLFALPHGDWLKDIDVREKLYTDAEANFYDAIRSVNKKAVAKLGIEELLEYSAARVRICTDNLIQIHPDS